MEKRGEGEEIPPRKEGKPSFPAPEGAEEAESFFRGDTGGTNDFYEEDEELPPDFKPSDEVLQGKHSKPVNDNKPPARGRPKRKPVAPANPKLKSVAQAIDHALASQTGRSHDLTRIGSEILVGHPKLDGDTRELMVSYLGESKAVADLKLASPEGAAQVLQSVASELDEWAAKLPFKRLLRSFTRLKPEWEHLEVLVSQVEESTAPLGNRFGLDLLVEDDAGTLTPLSQLLAPAAVLPRLLCILLFPPAQLRVEEEANLRDLFFTWAVQNEGQFSFYPLVNLRHGRSLVTRVLNGLANNLTYQAIQAQRATERQEIETALSQPACGPAAEQGTTATIGVAPTPAPVRTAAAQEPLPAVQKPAPDPAVVRADFLTQLKAAFAVRDAREARDAVAGAPEPVPGMNGHVGVAIKGIGSPDDLLAILLGAGAAAQLAKRSDTMTGGK